MDVIILIYFLLMLIEWYNKYIKDNKIDLIVIFY